MGIDPTYDEIAWAAGLFEGEGCALAYKDKRGKSEAGSWKPAVTLCMTDKEVVERFQEIVGFGNITEYQPKNKNWKLSYRWQSSSKIDVPKLKILMPWLSERRREQLEKALSVCVMADKTLYSKGTIEKMNNKIYYCENCGKGPLSKGSLTLHAGSKSCREMHERLWS